MIRVHDAVTVEGAEQGVFGPLQAVAHQDARRVAVVVKDEHVSEEASEGLDDTDLKVRERNQSEVDEAIRLRVARRTIHDVGFLFFVRHGNSGNHIRTEIDAQNKHGGQRRRNLGGDVAQERRDFRNVGRKRVRDGLLEVVKDETTFFDTIHDGGEVVIHENHVSRFLGNILTGDTHGDTDVTLLERRGVVDAITGDGDDFAASLAVFDDQELVCRRHARPNDLLVIESRVPLGALSDRVFNFSPRANVVALHDAGCAVVEVFLRDDVHLLRDGRCGDRVITRDHVNLDASAVALRHGFRNAFARRVNEREETDEGEVIDREVRLRLLGKLEVILESREFLERETEDALTATAEIFVRLRVGALEFGILARRLTVGKVRRALGQHALRRTLEHEQRRTAARLPVNGQLPLVRRVELDFEQLRVLGAGVESVVERLNQLEQTLFGSVTGGRLLENIEVRVHHFSLEVDEGAVFALRQVLGVVAQSGDLEQALERFRRLIVERFTIRRLAGFRDNLEIRDIFTRRAEVNLVVVPRVLHRHAVLRERTRLVGGDDSRRTESFDGFEVLHEHVLRVHALGSQSQRHSHGGEETFRHVGDDDTNHEDDVLNNRRPVGQTDDKENDTERDGDDRNELDELLDFLRNRRVFTARFRGETSDLTHDGAIAAADDDAATGTRVDDRRVEAQVRRFERLRDDFTFGVDREFRRTILRLRLTGQRRVVNLEFVGAHDANIRRDLVAVVEIDDITRNELPGIDDDSLAATDRLTLLRDHALETLHDGFGLGFLQEGKRRRNHDDGEEHHAEIQVRLILFTIDGVTNEAKHPTPEKQEREKVRKLHQKLDVPRRHLGRRQPVFAVLGAVLEHALVGQTIFERASKVRIELFRRPRVFDEVDILTERRGAFRFGRRLGRRHRKPLLKALASPAHASTCFSRITRVDRQYAFPERIPLARPPPSASRARPRPPSAPPRDRIYPNRSIRREPSPRARARVPFAPFARVPTPRDIQPPLARRARAHLPDRPRAPRVSPDRPRARLPSRATSRDVHPPARRARAARAARRARVAIISTHLSRVDGVEIAARRATQTAARAPSAVAARATRARGHKSPRRATSSYISARGAYAARKTTRAKSRPTRGVASIDASFCATRIQGKILPCNR